MFQCKTGEQASGLGTIDFGNVLENLAPERGEAYYSCICWQPHAWQLLAELAVDAIIAKVASDKIRAVADHRSKVTKLTHTECRRGGARTARG